MLNYIRILVELVSPLEEGEGVPKTASPEVVVEQSLFDVFLDCHDILGELLHLLIFGLDSVHGYTLKLSVPYF